MATKPSPRHLSILGVCAVFAYGLDQLTKQWALQELTPSQPRPVVGSWLQLHLTFNPGAAFSFATNATWLLSIIAAVVVIAVLFSARRLRNVGWAMGLGLLVGGALGNLSDRIFRAPGGGNGHVVDFLQLPNWPIFNVADMSICTAAGLIILQSFRGIGLDGSRDDEAQSGHSRDTQPDTAGGEASDAHQEAR